MKPKILVLSGYGLNCEEETAYAFTIAGGNTEIIHINDLIKNKGKLSSSQILVFPGGFSYGDDTGSGNAYALKVKNHLWDQITSFVTSDHLILGVCNGFQILTRLGLLPGLKKKYGTQQVALLPNENGRYTTRWVDLKITSDSPWTLGLEKISMPIAHGEGKFYADIETLEELKKKNMIGFQYIHGEVCEKFNFDKNPNGSILDIAGITNETGKILGLMPHPERSIFFSQLPDYFSQRESLTRDGKKIPKFTQSLQLFTNAIAYFH